MGRRSPRRSDPKMFNPSMNIHEERHSGVPITRLRNGLCAPCKDWWDAKPHGHRQDRYRGTAKGQLSDIRNVANRRGDT